MVTVIIIPLPLSLFSFTSESYYYMIIPMNGVKKTTEDLIFLSSGLELNLTTKFNDFLEELNGLSVPTRYPDELGKVLKQFSLAKTKTVYKSTKELLSWLKN